MSLASIIPHFNKKQKTKNECKRCFIIKIKYKV
jgi:hypothetical protein